MNRGFYTLLWWVTGYGMAAGLEFAVLPRLVGAAAPSLTLLVLVLGLVRLDPPAGAAFAVVSAVLRDAVAVPGGPAPVATHLALFVLIRLFSRLTALAELPRVIGASILGVLAYPIVRNALGAVAAWGGQAPVVVPLTPDRFAFRTAAVLGLLLAGVWWWWARRLRSAERRAFEHLGRHRA